MEIWEQILLLQVLPSCLPRWPSGSLWQPAHLTPHGAQVQPEAGTGWPGLPRQRKGFCAQLGTTPRWKAVGEDSVPPVPLACGQEKGQSSGLQLLQHPSVYPTSGTTEPGEFAKWSRQVGVKLPYATQSAWLAFLLNCWVRDRGFLWVWLLLCFWLFGFCSMSFIEFHCWLGDTS